MADKRRLRRALLKIDAIADPNTRASILRELRGELGDAFDPSRFGTATGDAWSFLSRCIELGAIRPFVDAVALVAGESIQWQGFADLVDELFPNPLLADTDRAALEAVLREVPAAVVVEASAACEVGPALPEHATTGDGGQVLAAIEAQVASGTAPLDRIFRFLEAVAHRAQPALNIKIHRAIAGAAIYLGVYEMSSRFCDEIANDLVVMYSVEPISDSDQQGENTLQTLKGRGLGSYGGWGSRARPVWARNPSMSSGRYWMRLRSVLTVAAS